MTMLDKFLNRVGATADREPAHLPCRHPSLAPMWESVQDMGERDKISRYKCEACQHILPASVGRALLAHRATEQAA